MLYSALYWQLLLSKKIVTFIHFKCKSFVIIKGEKKAADCSAAHRREYGGDYILGALPIPA